MGEVEGRREAMDRMVKQMVKGGFDPKYAREKARQSAINLDKSNKKK